MTALLDYFISSWLAHSIPTSIVICLPPMKAEELTGLGSPSYSAWSLHVASCCHLVRVVINSSVPLFLPSLSSVLPSWYVLQQAKSSGGIEPLQTARSLALILSKCHIILVACQLLNLLLPHKHHILFSAAVSLYLSIWSSSQIFVNTVGRIFLPQMFWLQMWYLWIWSD